MSKIDCNITENYLKEKARMTKSKGFIMCQIPCKDCPLDYNKNKTKMSCYRLQNTLPAEAIAIVQKWSDEHPAKTILDDFLEKYPKALVHKNGLPGICPWMIGHGETDCVKVSCEKCWNRPLEEVQK